MEDSRPLMALLPTCNVCWLVGNKFKWKLTGVSGWTTIRLSKRFFSSSTRWSTTTKAAWTAFWMSWGFKSGMGTSGGRKKSVPAVETPLVFWLSLSEFGQQTPNTDGWLAKRHGVCLIKSANCVYMKKHSNNRLQRPFWFMWLVQVAPSFCFCATGRLIKKVVSPGKTIWPTETSTATKIRTAQIITNLRTSKSKGKNTNFLKFISRVYYWLWGGWESKKYSPVHVEAQNDTGRRSWTSTATISHFINVCPAAALKVKVVSVCPGDRLHSLSKLRDDGSERKHTVYLSLAWHHSDAYFFFGSNYVMSVVPLPAAGML